MIYFGGGVRRSSQPNNTHTMYGMYYFLPLHAWWVVFVQNNGRISAPVGMLRSQQLLRSKTILLLDATCNFAMNGALRRRRARASGSALFPSLPFLPLTRSRNRSSAATYVEFTCVFCVQHIKDHSQIFLLVDASLKESMQAELSKTWRKNSS